MFHLAILHMSMALVPVLTREFSVVDLSLVQNKPSQHTYGVPVEVGELYSTMFISCLYDNARRVAKPVCSSQSSAHSYLANFLQ